MSRVSRHWVSESRNFALLLCCVQGEAQRHDLGHIDFVATDQLQLEVDVFQRPRLLAVFRLDIAHNLYPV